MATYTAGITSNATTNAASYNGGSHTPADGDLIVAFVRSGETVSAGGFSSSLGETFTNVCRTMLNGGVDFIDVFIANAFTTADVRTYTWTCTGDNANGWYLVIGRLSGMTRTGLSAIRQFAEQEEQAAGGTPAPTFAAACLTGNPTVACAGNLTASSGLTVPSGWTLRTSASYSTPTTAINLSSRNSGFTGTTVTWGSTSATVFGAVIIEYDTSAPAAAAEIPTLVTRR